jgi:hypothetical protein
LRRKFLTKTPRNAGVFDFAEEKTYTMSDGRGFMLEVRPYGSKLWIARY